MTKKISTVSGCEMTSMTIMMTIAVRDAIKEYVAKHNTFVQYVVETALVEFLNKGRKEKKLTARPTKTRLYVEQK